MVQDLNSSKENTGDKENNFIQQWLAWFLSSFFGIKFKVLKCKFKKPFTWTLKHHNNDVMFGWLRGNL